MPQLSCSIIISVRNCFSETKQCLDSLLNHFDDSIGEVILIDDASDEETAKFLIEFTSHSKFKLIRNNQNLGFGISNNRAAYCAECTHLLFLNNDTILSNGWLEPIVEGFSENSELKNVGCLGNVQDDPRKKAVDHAGVIFKNGIPEHDSLGVRKFERVGYSEFLAVTGACFMIRKELFLSVGGFDEEYRTGFEDIDLCLKLKMLGFNHYVSNESRILHKKSSTSGRNKYQGWNSNVFYNRWRKLITRFQEWDLTQGLIRENGNEEILSVNQKFVCERGRYFLFADSQILLFWLRKFEKENSVSNVVKIRKLITEVCNGSIESIEATGVEHLIKEEFDKAEILFEQCIASSLEDPRYLELLAECKKRAGDIVQAQKNYHKAIKLFPFYLNSFHGLAECKILKDKVPEAINVLKKSQLIEPDNKLTWIKLANCYSEMSQWTNAVFCFEKGLQEKNVDKTWLYENAFRAFCESSNFQKAWAFYQQYSDYLLSPDSILRAANITYHLGLLSRAEVYLNIYLELNGGDIEAHSLMGNIKVGLRQFKEAVRQYDLYLQLNPHSSSNFSNMVNSKSFLCQWGNWDLETEKVQLYYRKGLLIPNPFDVVGLNLVEEDECRLGELKSNIEVKKVDKLKKQLAFQYTSVTRERKRLGFISSDLRGHAVGHLIARLLECLNRNRYEIYIYSTSPKDGNQVQRRIHAVADKNRYLYGCSTKRKARIIHQDKLDMLIDLGGFSIGNNVETLALRPAPRQVHFLGYASSMGIGLVDYIIADKKVLPASSSKLYAEKIVYMNGCFFPPGDFSNFAPRGMRKNFGLPSRGIVYCAFHAAYKLEPIIWSCWMRILKAVPESVLWLKFKPAEDAIKNLRSEAVRQGVSSKRIIMAEDMPDRSAHLSRMTVADLYLDCPLYNGHASAMDALHAKLPILTIKGNRFCNRVGESFLKHLGLPELVARDLQQYERTAIKLGLRPSKLLPLRKQIQENADAVLSPADHTKRFEFAVEQILSKKPRVIKTIKEEKVKALAQIPKASSLADFTLVMIRPMGVTNWAYNVNMLAYELSKYGGQCIVLETTHSENKRSDFSKSVKRIPQLGQNLADAYNFALSQVSTKFIFFLDNPLRVLPSKHFVHCMLKAKASIDQRKVGMIGIGSNMEPNTGVLVTQSQEVDKSKIAGFFAPSFILNTDALTYTGGFRPFGNSLALPCLDISLRMESNGFRSVLVEVDNILCPAHSGKDYLQASSQGMIARFEKMWKRKPVSLKVHSFQIRNKQDTRIPKQIREGKTVGIFLTLFYEDLGAEIYRYISQIPFKATVYLSSSLPLIKFKHFVRKLGHEVISNYPVNFGMDIGDFIFQLRNLKLFDRKHDYYLKIHTKRDARWRNGMLNNLIPKRNYQKIFDLLDSQHFLSSSKYTFPISSSLANKSIIGRELIKNKCKTENIFSIPSQNDEIFCLKSYYKYNKDLKNLTRNFLNTAKKKEFETFLYEHFHKTKFKEKHRIKSPVISNGNDKYEYPAGTMFWFDNFYLAKLEKNSTKFEEMLEEMSGETGLLVNDTPTYTHFLENWFGLIASQINKRKLITIRSITFLLPYLHDETASSGGIRTLLNIINFLHEEGYFISIQFCGCSYEMNLKSQYKYTKAYGIVHKIDEINFACEQDFVGSDVYVATGWQTFEKSVEYESSGMDLCFFCQDLEYEFSAVRTHTNLKLKESILAFYKLARPTFTIGRYLGNKLSEFHEGRIIASGLTVDHNIFKINSFDRKRRGICILFSSSKSHRLPNIAIEVMRKLIVGFPQYPIYVFGDINSKDKLLMPRESIILGTLSLNKLCELYNKCKIGTCFSTTNPSRIGFEMSACGCPCVEIDCSYTKFDLSRELFTKCEPDSENIYAAIKKLLTEPVEYESKYSKCVTYSSNLKFQESEQKTFSKMLNDTFYK